LEKLVLEGTRPEVVSIGGCHNSDVVFGGFRFEASVPTPSSRIGVRELDFRAQWAWLMISTRRKTRRRELCGRSKRMTTDSITRAGVPAAKPPPPNRLFDSFDGASCSCLHTDKTCDCSDSTVDGCGISNDQFDVELSREDSHGASRKSNNNFKYPKAI
jgi:hypothetical protein